MKPNPIRSFHVFHRFSQRRHCGLAAALCVFAGSAAGYGADLLKWDVTGTTGTTGSGIASAPSAGVSGSLMSTATTTGNTAGNSTSPAATWNRTFSVTADFAAAQTAGNYFSFTTTAASGYTVSISGMTGLNLVRTSSGPTSAGLFYSTDGVNFTQTGTTFTVGSTSASAAANFSETMAVTPIVITGGNTVSWRLVVFGGTAVSRMGIGNGGTEDFVLTGTSVSDVVVRDLAWTGTGGSAWNTLPGNKNWADTGAGNTAAAFASNDNVSINSAATIAVDAAGVTAGSMAVSNTSSTVTLNGGSISALSLSKSGAGSLVLGGSNTFTGGISLTGGSLRINSTTALGATSLAINGATFVTSNTVSTYANVISAGVSGATFNTEGDITFSGTIASSGASPNVANVITKTGSGVLTLSRTGSTAFGAQTTSGQAASMIEFDIAAGGGVVFSGTGQRNLGGTSTWDSPVTLAGGTIKLHGGAVDGTGSINMTESSTLASRLNYGTATVSLPIQVTAAKVLSLDVDNGSNALAVSGVISGDGGITKLGGGTARIEGSNTYTGTTTITAGTLRIGTGTSGTLGSGPVVITLGTLFLNREDSVTIGNAISGAGNVTVSAGSGSTTTLTSSNTYTGVTTCSGGTLAVTVLTDGGIPSGMGSSSSDPGNLVLSSGSLAYAGSSDASTDRQFSLGILGGGLSASGTGRLQFSNTSSLALPDPAVSGVTGLTAGTTYKIVNNVGTDFTLIGAADNNIGTTFVATGPGTGSGQVIYANTRVLRLGGTAPGVQTLAAQIDDGTNAATGLSKNGATTWSITGANTYKGATNINAGTLRIDGNNGNATGTISVAAGASLGGNGVSGAPVVLAAGGGLAITLSNWTGAPGTGYDDLDVASLNAGGGAMTLTLNTTDLTNFTETGRSFTLLKTTGGITGFNPANVTITTPGFSGSGTWALAAQGNNLVATYTVAVTDPYQAWIAAYHPAAPNNALSADPDGDGMSNLLEFVLNGHPGVADLSILPVRTVTATHLEFVFTRREDSKADVTQVVQYGSGLAAWTDLLIPAAAGTHSVGVATVVVDDGTPATNPDTITVRIPRTSAVAGKLFCRLVVSK